MSGTGAGRDRIGVLFVCMGNICRSPLAEAIFRSLAARGGLEDRLDIDSCGTGGWHVGEGTDPRSVQVAAVNGLRIDHTARQFDAAQDLARFDLLVAMDRQNAKELLEMGAEPSRVRLMLSFDPNAGSRIDVPDPFYGGDDGFARVFEMLRDACAGLLDHVRSEGFPRR